LRLSSFLHCHEVKLDDRGEISELRCTVNDTPLGLGAKAGKKPAIIHWVSVPHSIKAEVRLYDKLFQVPKPTGDLVNEINPNSLVVMPQARLESSLASAEAGERFQFERVGYFITDPKEHTANRPLYNRITTLKDSRNKPSSGRGTS
jgi:glutaminyl-tRNA synthetase